MGITFNAKVRGFILAAVAVLVVAFAAIAYQPAMAYAADPDPATAITVEAPGVSQDFTYQELLDHGIVKADTIGGLYNKPGQGFTIVGGKNYVKIDDLIKLAGVSDDVWKDGATLSFVCADGPYNKYYPTYKEVTRPQFFYPNTTQTIGSLVGKVPTFGALAFNNAQRLISVDGTAQTTLDGIGNDWDNSPRIILGLTGNEIFDSSFAMGKRMPTDVETITVNPAS